MLRLYWYFRECWILRGFRGVLTGVKYKFFLSKKRRFETASESWDFT